MRSMLKHLCINHVTINPHGGPQRKCIDQDPRDEVLKTEQRPSAKGSQRKLYLNENHVHAAARRVEAGMANPDLLMRLKVQIDMASWWALNYSSQKLRNARGNCKMHIMRSNG